MVAVCPSVSEKKRPNWVPVCYHDASSSCAHVYRQLSDRSKGT